MKIFKKEFFVAAACFAAAVISGLILFMVHQQQGMFLPSWVRWSQKTESAGELKCSVQDRHLFLEDISGNMIFESPKEYRVQDAFTGDIDSDGNTELVVLLWKKGAYGPSRPFWVKENDNDWGQHIFIYRYDGTLNIIWGTSYIPFEIEKMIYDPDTRIIHIVEHGTGESDWMWLSWGLVNIE